MAKEATMKKFMIIAAGLGLLLGSMLLIADTQTGFSGTWKLDRSRSDMPPPMGRGGPGRMGGDRGGMTNGGARRGRGMPGGRGMGPGPAGDVVLIINQTQDFLTVVRTTGEGDEARKVEQHYSLDGMESTNPAPMGDGYITSIAELKNNVLTIRNSHTVSTPEGNMEMQSSEEFSLADNGNTLMIKTTRNTPMGERTFTEVYIKQ
jgi:hypothetical protein